MNLDDIISEAFLIEAVALTKGSQRVMNDKNLVSALAARVRRDADFNPSVFPKGADVKFEKAPDEDVAHWFLENIDKIEKEGYEGTIYSRDGLYSDWIVRRYIAGSHTWEDLIGVMNMNLRDWTILKNRNELDDAHKEVSKFKGVRDIGAYMVHHYNDKLEDVRNAAKFAARDKMARAIPIVNNESYKIFIALNRAAACKLGNGTQWCTANSISGTNYDNYSAQAMLYQMFPNAAETVSKKGALTGKIITGKEKYQFGPDRLLSFKDIADEDVNKEEMRTKFPYLYTDLVTALKHSKAKIEELDKTFAEDPMLQDAAMSKVNRYNVDDEIEKLKRFVEAGYMTDKVRPKEIVQKDDAGQPHPQIAAPAEPVPQQGQAPTESIAELAESMIIEDTLMYVDRARLIFEERIIEDDRELIEYLKKKTKYLYNKEFISEDSYYASKRSDGSIRSQLWTRLNTSIRRPLKETDGYEEIKYLIDRIEDYNIPSDEMIQVGDDLSVLQFEIIYAHKEIEIHGFVNPKEVVKITMSKNGNIQQITFSDGDTYPRCENAVYKGRPTSNYAFLRDKASSMEALSTIKMSLPNDWDIISYPEDMKQIGEEEAPIDDLETMGAGAGPTGGGKYPPGTAPTMPESFNNKGTEIMEQVDKDVAAMLGNLKKYDKLNESVLGMVTLGKENTKIKEEGNPWENLGKDDKEKDLKDGESKKSSTGGTTTKTKTGLVHKQKSSDVKEADEVDEKAEEEDKDKMEESADPAVLEWMSRFSKLGNMKGYGR